MPNCGEREPHFSVVACEDGSRGLHSGFGLAGAMDGNRARKREPIFSVVSHKEGSLARLALGI